MIRINLIGGEKARKKSAAFDAGQRLTVACSLVLLLAVAGMGWWYFSLDQASAQVDRDIAEAQQQIMALQPVLAEVQQAQQREQQLRQRVALIEQLRSGQSLPVQLLDHVSKSLPDMLWLTQMNQQNNEVTIEGQSTTLISLSDFVGNLGNTTLLQKPIEIVSSQVESVPVSTGTVTTSNVDLIRFVVKAQIAAANLPKPPAPAPAPAPARAGGAAPPAAGGAR